ncbi:MAG: putative toxin-antitoxin system toxin component, PIN family, partial [Kosmotogaceae bacterium]
MRVMIDSNTFLSGIAFDGMERLLLRALVHSDHVLLLAKFSLSEVERVLRRKFPNTIEDYEDVLQSIDAEILPLPDKSEVEQCIEIIKDEHDAPILASAIKARPDVFVTGDKDFFEERVRVLI